MGHKEKKGSVKFQSSNRKATILNMIDRKGFGLEIGPGADPIAPKSEGFHVKTLDIANRNHLITKFTKRKEDNSSGYLATLSGSSVKVDVSKYEEVDYVWYDQPYKELIGVEKHFDWVIASHVIEHTTDLVDYLKNIDGILKDTGVLALAVPDKRFCFDHFRPISGLSSVIDAYLQRRNKVSIGSIAEYYLNVAVKGNKPGWNYHHQGDYDFKHSLSDAKEMIELRKKGQIFPDIHNWCFTPSSFRLIVHDLNQMGLINLKEISYVVGGGQEFYIALSKSGPGYLHDRSNLLYEIQEELKFNGYSSLKSFLVKFKEQVVRKIKKMSAFAAP